MEYPNNLKALECQMHNTLQTQGMNVYQHGKMVHDYFCDLRNHILKEAELKYSWRLPEWALNKTLWDQLIDFDIIKEYQVYHDSGKPYCLVVDESGRQHFPDHANVSEQVWLRIGGNPVAARCMGLDMLVHTMKADQVPYLSQLPEARTLLLTALCEVHANASMFGGIESVSFKSKYKQIDRRGKALTKIWMQESLLEA